MVGETEPTKDLSDFLLSRLLISPLDKFSTSMNSSSTLPSTAKGKDRALRCGVV